MALPVNAARGEVPLTVGAVELVIAAEIAKLSAVSTEIGCMSISELYRRMMGAEVAAVVAGIRYLTVKGNAAAALAALKLSHFPACKEAFSAALAHHTVDDEGKGAAAGEAAPATT